MTSGEELDLSCSENCGVKSYKTANTALRCERCDTLSLSLNEHGKKDKRMPSLRRFDLYGRDHRDALQALRYFEP